MTLQILASLADDSKGAIYDCNMVMVETQMMTSLLNVWNSYLDIDLRHFLFFSAIFGARTFPQLAILPKNPK